MEAVRKNRRNIIWMSVAFSFIYFGLCYHPIVIYRY